MAQSDLVMTRGMVTATVIMMAMPTEEGMIITTMATAIILLRHLSLVEEEGEDAVEAEDLAVVVVDLMTEVKLLLKAAKVKELQGRQPKVAEMSPKVPCFTLLQWFKPLLVAEVVLDTVDAALFMEDEVVDEAGVVAVRKLLA